jgi:arylsulfatase A-like enzyme
MLKLPATVLAAALLGAPPAAAGCLTGREADDLERSLRRAVSCNQDLLKGRGGGCKERPAPACAGSLPADALALAYGPNDPPAAAVDDRALDRQLQCQKKIGEAVAYYVGKKLRGLQKGKQDDAVAEAAARLKLDRLPRHCGVEVARDPGGVALPAVGPQCAAAVGDVGATADPASLAECLATLLGVWVARAGPDPQPLRPNILLILTDDQRWDSTDGTHGDAGADVMPRTRAELAGRGVEFREAFVTTPLCCPSRSSLLSGSYAHRTGVYRNGGIHGGADDFDDASSVATWLQEAGYRTSLLGKYLNGYPALWDDALEPPYVPPGWSEWRGMKSVKFFDYVMIEPDGGGGYAEVPYGSAEPDYSTDVLREKAKAFVSEAVAAGEPFFLYLAFKAPHLPQIPAPRHEGLFQQIPPWRPPSYDEADVSDKPGWVQNTPLMTPEEEADLDQVRIDQLEMLQAVDEAIGGSPERGIVGIMEHLRALGVAEDTLVVFLSDNGWHWGEHRTRAKNKPYEESIRTPLLVHYPRLAPLLRSEARFALNIDLAPTFAELAGATVPTEHDGVSLVRVLDGTQPAGTWRTDFLTEGWPRSHVWATVREAQWKYTELPLVLGDPNTAFELELYDLAADPYELENLAGDPQHAQRIEQMAARLRALRPGWPGDSDPGVEEPPDPDDD